MDKNLKKYKRIADLVKECWNTLFSKVYKECGENFSGIVIEVIMNDGTVIRKSWLTKLRKVK